MTVAESALGTVAITCTRHLHVVACCLDSIDRQKGYSAYAHHCNRKGDNLFLHITGSRYYNRRKSGSKLLFNSSKEVPFCIYDRKAIKVTNNITKVQDYFYFVSRAYLIIYLSRGALNSPQFYYFFYFTSIYPLFILYCISIKARYLFPGWERFIPSLGTFLSRLAHFQ